MADNFTQFSFMMELGTAEAALKAQEIYDRLELEAEDNLETLQFELEIEESTQLWIYDGEGYGSPDHVVMFLHQLAKETGLTGKVGFTWSHTCTKPRLNEFGGGAVLVVLEDAEKDEWLDAHEWLEDLNDPAEELTHRTKLITSNAM